MSDAPVTNKLKLLSACDVFKTTNDAPKTAIVYSTLYQNRKYFMEISEFLVMINNRIESDKQHMWTIMTQLDNTATMTDILYKLFDYSALLLDFLALFPDEPITKDEPVSDNPNKLVRLTHATLKLIVYTVHIHNMCNLAIIGAPPTADAQQQRDILEFKLKYGAYLPLMRDLWNVVIKILNTCLVAMQYIDIRH